MSPILDPSGNPIKPAQDKPKDEVQDQSQEAPPTPQPKVGDLLVGAFVDQVIDEDGKRTVSLSFQIHQALAPMEVMNILNEFALKIQPAAQQQIASSIQRADPSALKQLEQMGLKPPSK